MIYTFKCLKCGQEKDLLVSVMINIGDFIEREHGEACGCGGTRLERIYTNKGRVGLQGCSNPNENS